MFQANDLRPGLPILLAAAGLAVAGCQPKKGAPPPPAAPAAAPATLPQTAPTIDRAALLQAIAAARAAYSAGHPPSGEPLSGRRFTLRQAFGCTGPAPTAPAGEVRWDWTVGRDAIEMALTPADWTSAPVIAAAAADAPPWEAVEGFWITRPWLLVEGCPAAVIGPATGTPLVEAPRTVGLAAVFKAGGSRVGRRDGRAFAFTLRGEPPEPPIGGYRLVIEGRFAGFPDGHAIRCRAASADVEPVCVAAAEVDRVAFENASGKVFREWRVG